MRTRTEIEAKIKELTNPDEIKLLEWILQDDNDLIAFTKSAIKSYDNIPDQVRDLRYKWYTRTGQRLGLKESVDLIKANQ